MNRLSCFLKIVLSKKGMSLTYLQFFLGWAGVFLIFACFSPIRFETNDDVMMLMISSGAYSGTPDFHLVFINVIYGLLVKALYIFLPGLEWYTILFCLLHIISFSLIFWIYSKRLTTAFGQLLLLLLLLVLQSRFVIGFQFTTTAAVVAYAGLLLYFERGKYIRIVGLLLFFIGSLVRFDAAMLCLGVYAPVMMFPLSGRIRSKRQFLQTGIILSLIVVLPVVAKIIDRQVYNKDSGWHYYMEYNRVRGALNDNPNFEKLLSVKSDCFLADINDLKNLGDFIPDPAVLDLEVITAVKDSLDDDPIHGKIQNVGMWIQSYQYTILLIFVLVSLLLFERKNPYRWSLFLLGLSFIMLLSFVSLNATIKERVFLSAIIPLMLILTLLIVNYQKRDWRIIVLSVFYLLILGTIVQQSIDLYVVKKDQRQLIVKQLNLIRSIDKHDIVPFGANLILEGLSPFRITSLFKSFDKKLLGVGWMSQIPLNRGRMDSHLDFVGKSILIFLHKDSEPSIRNIQYCIRKNYQTETTLEIVAKNEFYEIVALKKIVE